MAYKPRHLMTLFLPALLLAGFAVSCTDTDVLPDAGTPSIDFGTPALTRGVVTSDADMDAFDVWGWYKPTEGNETATDTQVFNATPVTKKGDSWKYDNPQRWLLGNTYRFYAVYPSVGATNKGYESALYDKDGNLTITNFDCTKGVDLMTASQNCVADEMIAEKKRVSMDFGHELARLKFTVKSENTVATISSFKVYGVNYQGTLTKGQTATWDPVTSCTEANTPYKLENFIFNTTYGFEKDMLGDVLLIPGTNLTDAKLYIAYKYQGDTVDRTSTIDLQTTAITQWDAGKSYHYTLTIKGGTLTVTVKVVDWTEMDTSVSWG